MFEHEVEELKRKLWEMEVEIGSLFKAIEQLQVFVRKQQEEINELKAKV